MMRFQWNALRVGDRVMVHDASDAHLGAIAGVVSIVDTKVGSNDLGIRVGTGDAPTRMVRPTRLSVHLDPIAGTEDCWRCDAMASR
jgi:hypothetical protein